jgi:hypothetical protein
MSSRLWILAVLVFAAAGALGWLQADISPQVVAPTRGVAAPTLAGPPPSTVAADIAVLAQRQPWGASPRPAEQPAAPTGGQNQDLVGSWRIGGIIRLGQQSLVILMVQPQPNVRHVLRYLPIGEKLPDGRTIERITGDSVILRQGDSVTVLRLYSPDAG